MLNKMLKEHFLENFIEMIVAERNAAPNTVSSYSSDLNKFADFIGDQDFWHITQKDIEKYLTDQKMQGMGVNTILRIISSLRQFYNFAVEEGWTTNNPIDAMIAPKKPKLLPKTLSEDEIVLLLDIAHQGNTPEDIRLSALLEILYASGLRVSELLSLPLSCLTTQNPKALQVMILIKGKGGKERLVPLNTMALQAISRYLLIRQIFIKTTKQQKWLFPSYSKQGFLTRQRFGQLLKDLANKAGLPAMRVSPHIIRHAFATHMLHRGADLLVLQKLLGHVDISTTEIYTHVMPDNLKIMLEQCHPLAKLS